MGEKKRRQSALTGQAGTSQADPSGGAPISTPALIARPAFEADLEQIWLIYRHHVLTSTGTFDIDPPDLEAMRARWSKIAANGWPFLVACAPMQFSRVLGFAYAQPFRERKAYAQTFEDSVYVAPFMEKRGIGTLLLAALIEDCTALGTREMIAVIGDYYNHASISLHAKLGFEPAGQLRNVGYKFGRWLDVLLMQRRLVQPNTP